jgi:hypothetical protein
LCVQNPDYTDLCIVPDIFMSLQQQEQPDIDSVRGTGEDGCLWTNEAAGPREARVLRYKEKRRSRLFSKKIRYHARKFNAERRPRMKVSSGVVKNPLEIIHSSSNLCLSMRLLLFACCISGSSSGAYLAVSTSFH